MKVCNITQQKFIREKNIKDWASDQVKDKQVKKAASILKNGI